MGNALRLLHKPQRVQSQSPVASSFTGKLFVLISAHCRNRWSACVASLSCHLCHLGHPQSSASPLLAINMLQYLSSPQRQSSLDGSLPATTSFVPALLFTGWTIVCPLAPLPPFPFFLSPTASKKCFHQAFGEMAAALQKPTADSHSSSDWTYQQFCPS